MGEGQAGRVPLLATKVHLPPRIGAEVERGRLRRIVEGVLAPGRCMLLVSAPAGFGKTTLLSGWIDGNAKARFSWISLDPDDNDPVRFLSYLAFALRQAHLSFGVQAEQALCSAPVPPAAGGTSPRLAITLLLNDLAALPGQQVIVLDDFHHVSSPAVLTEVAYALEHWPANARLVLSTRVDPPLQLSRLRAGGRLIEIRASHLRFTAEESAEFLLSSVQPVLEPEQVLVIDQRADGWIAGLKMTALAIGGSSDARSVVRGLAGNPHLVLDYLAEEVLERQDEQVQQFLVQTAILDRFCTSLCNAVTGRTDSGEILNEVRRRNLFLTPLDDVDCWFRYHPLLADLLRARLQRHQPELPAVLHRRASQWFDANALPNEAVQHARAAGDIPLTIELVVRHSRRLIWGGWSATVLRWLKAIPEKAIQEDLRLIISRCWVNCFMDDWQLMRDDLARAEELLHEAALPWGGAPVSDDLGKQIRHNSRITVAILRAFVAFRQNELLPARDLARRAVQIAEGAPPDLQGAALAILAYVLKELGPLEEAQDALLRSGTLFLAQQNMTAWAICIHQQVDILIARGLLGEAGRVSEEAFHLLRERDSLGLPAAGRVFVIGAEIACLRNDLREARACWNSAAASGELTADPVVVGCSRLGRARLAAAEGKVEEALDLLKPAEETALSLGSKSILQETAALRALLWERTGRLEQLRHAAEAAKLPAGSGCAADGFVRIRGLMHDGQFAAARQLAQELAEEARSAGRVGSVPAFLVLQARVEWAQGQREAALTVLRRALELAAPEEALRAFLDEGEALREPIEELRVRCRNTSAGPGSRAGAVIHSLDRLHDALGRAPVPPSRTGHTGLRRRSARPVNRFTRC